MAEIRIENLHKSFGDFVAVRESNFTIENGEFFVMLGPSGCGKTTTLRMIAGLELPTSGAVFLDGEAVTYLRASQRDIAFVFQLFALYPHMNVRRNISFPLRVQRLPRREVRARTEEVTRLERGLTFLATTASTAPFIGLFGTVWGIMTAFIGLASTGTTSSIQAVAPGIAEALIATAVGLAAAIPAVVMYNRFARQLRVLMAQMDTFGAEFLNIAERHFLKR